MKSCSLICEHGYLIRFLFNFIFFFFFFFFFCKLDSSMQVELGKQYLLAESNVEDPTIIVSDRL